MLTIFTIANLHLVDLAYILPQGKADMASRGRCFSARVSKSLGSMGCMRVTELVCRLAWDCTSSKVPDLAHTLCTTQNVGRAYITPHAGLAGLSAAYSMWATLGATGSRGVLRHMKH